MPLSSVRRLYYRTAAALAWRRLRSLSGQALQRRAERAALRAFHRAARRVPAYAALLRERSVNPDDVRDIESFRRLVPLTDKQSVFAENDLPSLCLDGKTGNATRVYTSSGYSGVFSFGLETGGDARRGRAMLDLLLTMYFHVASRRTLLINTLPMGVQVPASLPVKFDSSVRSDAVIAVVKAAGGTCQQTVIEHPFLKKVLEEGLDAGVDWPSYRVSLVTGAEVVPESFRSYAGAILGHDPADPERGQTLVTLGVSEVGLLVGFETEGCRRIRRLAFRDEALSRAVFGEAPFLPTFVQYFPRSLFIETPTDEAGRPRLIITTADSRRRIPLIRYSTGDWAEVRTHRQVRQALKSCGRGDLVPDIELPFLVMWGRGKSLAVAGRELFPEQIEEALYTDPAVAAATTANFRMASQGGKLHLTFQLRPAYQCSPTLEDAFRDLMGRSLGIPVEVRLVCYKDFREALDVCYQRKFQHI